MTDKEQQQERWIARMRGDFNPGYVAGSLPKAEDRLANAAEYAAFQLGQIGKSLEEINEILKAVHQKM